MQEENFADEIYKIFKSKRKTALRCNDLTEAYKKLYGRTLNTTELRELPFIQFEKNGGDYNNNIIYLVVELDDCCNKCKFRYCKLLHSVDPNDKFQCIYQHQSRNDHNNNNSKPKLSKIQRPSIRLIQRLKDILTESTSNPKQLTLTELKRIHNKKFPAYKSHEPSSHGIAIRFKSTFHIGYDEASGDHLIMYKHNQNHANLNSPYKNQPRYHQNHSNNQNVSNNYKKSNVIINTKKSHQSPWHKKAKSPVKTQISLNTKSKNHKNNNNKSIGNDSKLSSSSNSNKSKHSDHEDHQKKNKSKHKHIGSSIIPEQSNKYYLSITISPEWNDSKLIPDLVRHISKHTGKHVCDAYIANRIRLGFFTAKTQHIAQQFVKNVKEKKMKCWGRTVNAEIIPLPKNNEFHGNGIQRQQTGYRVRIQNVNCIMDRDGFGKWLYAMTKTNPKKNSIYDIEIVFPKLQRGSSQCIMLFDKYDDTQYVLEKIQNEEFRGYPLKFKHWNHPNQDNKISTSHSKPSPNKKHSNNRNNNNNNNNNVNSKGMNPQNRSPQQPHIALNNKNAIKKTSSSKPQTGIWAKMAKQRKQHQIQQQQPQIPVRPTTPNTDSFVKPNMDKNDSNSISEPPLLPQQSSTNSNKLNDTPSISSQRSNTPFKTTNITISSHQNTNNVPLQPTKPPINTNNNSNNNNRPTTPTITTPNMNAASSSSTPSSASSSVSTDSFVPNGNKPRVPPLLNNRFRNSNTHNNDTNTRPISPSMDHSTQTPPQELIQQQQIQTQHQQQQQYEEPPQPQIQIQTQPEPEVTENLEQIQPVQSVLTEPGQPPQFEVIAVPQQEHSVDDHQYNGNISNQQSTDDSNDQSVAQETSSQIQPPQQPQQPQQPPQIQVAQQSQQPQNQQAPQQQSQTPTSIQVNGNLLNNAAILNQPLTPQQIQQMQLNPVYLQQLQQMQNNQIRIAMLTQQQIQQLQQTQIINPLQTGLQTFPSQQFQIPNISGLTNIYSSYPPTVPNLNMNMQSYIQSMPPPPSSFSNINFTPTPQPNGTNTNNNNNNKKDNNNTNTVNNTAPTNNNNNSFVPRQKPQMTINNNSNHNNHNQYQSAPQHQPQPQPQHQHPPQQQQQQHHNQHRQNFRNQSFQNNMNHKMNKGFSHHPHIQHNQHNQRNKPRRLKQDPLDKLCKFCLLEVHDPAKCVWFNPNALRKH